ncbi:MAG: hypothetical protein AAF998_24800 [Bacteroidota bacterium]
MTEEGYKAYREEIWVVVEGQSDARIIGFSWLSQGPCHGDHPQILDAIENSPLYDALRNLKQYSQSA